MTLLLSIVAAGLGILLYTFLSAKNYLNSPEWSWPKFVVDNLAQTVWSLLVAILIAVIMWVIPGSGEKIVELTGLDISVEDDGSINLVSFLILGFILSVIIRTGGK